MFNSNFNFNFKSINSFKVDQQKNINLLSFKSFKLFTYLKILIITFYISYKKEKLIKYFNNNILIPN